MGFGGKYDCFTLFYVCNLCKSYPLEEHFVLAFSKILQYCMKFLRELAFANWLQMPNMKPWGSVKEREQRQQLDFGPRTAGIHKLFRTSMEHLLRTILFSAGVSAWISILHQAEEGQIQGN